MRKFAIGIDSVDSVYVGCTTHFTVFLIRELTSNNTGFFISDLPHLVRLNQFIPWKTRGNASVGILLETDRPLLAKDILRMVLRKLDIYSGGIIGNDPGIVVLDVDEGSENLEDYLYKLYNKALVDILPFQHISHLLENTEGLLLWGKRGVIGALSAIGFMLKGSRKTFELIAYRKPDNILKKRAIDDESIKEIEIRSGGKIFNNYNYREKKSVASPRGYDPVLIGLRGAEPHLLIKLAHELRLNEAPDAWMLFATNQHLDEHRRLIYTNELRTFTSGLIEGVVESSPLIYKKGHVRIALRDATGSVEVFFFSPSNPMNKIAMKLRRGDYVGVLGGSKPSDRGKIFEAHKLWVYESPPETLLSNPLCPICRYKLKSNGKSGMKCPKCGYRTRSKFKTLKIANYRDLRGVYTPEPGRVNHLVKPSWINFEVEGTSYRPEEIFKLLGELESR